MNVRKIVRDVLGDALIVKIREVLERISPAQRQLALKRKRFYEKFINKEDLCFDVGANIGNRVAPLLKIGARVIAVEPQKFCYEILKSKFKNKITLVTKGIGDKEGIRKLYISNVSKLSSFSTEWINAVKNNRFKDYRWDNTVDVEMTTLDNLIAEYGKPSFIKIDVEGYELEVLKGLSKPVKMISFEYTVPDQTDRIIDCINVVKNISPDILCNYSIGESMEWALKSWLSVSEFLELIKDADFINTGFGDIYLKQAAV